MHQQSAPAPRPVLRSKGRNLNSFYKTNRLSKHSKPEGVNARQMNTTNASTCFIHRTILSPTAAIFIFVPPSPPPASTNPSHRPGAVKRLSINHHLELMTRLV